MPTPPNDWSADRRLDILIFGPMGDMERGSPTLRIREAVEALLAEGGFGELLQKHGVRDFKVNVPERLNETEIVHSIFNLLDVTDLVIFDLTPKPSNPDRANVFYELALVHALGIPAMVMIQEGSDVPFYAKTTTQYRVKDFQQQTLTEALREPLREFLDLDNRSVDFTSNRITQFFGLPIVDISAAVGLATGHYFNFLGRLIMEGGFLAHYPESVRQVIYVRPSSIFSTYEADVASLKALLSKEGWTPQFLKLPTIPSDDKGIIWFDHIEGIIVDIPRMLYPLRRSPRLLALQQRNQSFASPGAERLYSQRLRRMEKMLLDRVEEAIRYQMRQDGPRVRPGMLHFSRMEDVPALVRSFL